MATLRLFWVISVALAMVTWLIITVILIPILNPIFDPDWKERYHELTRKGMPFFGAMRAMHYAGAVASGVLARRVFQDTEYDFRGRVGRPIYLLCVLQQVAGFYLLLVLVLYLIHEAVDALTV